MKYSSSQLVKFRGKWQGQIKFKDDLGKWKKKTKMLSATGKREAQRELEAWRDEMEAAAEEEEAIRTAGGRPGETVAEYVERYVDARAGTVAASSLSGYRTLLKNHIAPYLGGVALRDLTAEGVESWLVELSREHSASTANKALTLLRSALTVAHTRGLIASNPTAGIKKLKERHDQPNALDARECGKVATFIDSNPTDAVSMAIRLALYTGMRRGEICGLRWKNVDTSARTLRVAESLGRADGQAIRDAGLAGAEMPYADAYIKEPKNRGSIRTVGYPKSVADALDARRAAMKARCLESGAPFSDSLFVCGDVDGKPLRHQLISRKWRVIANLLDLTGTEGKRPTFHDLRHTYATLEIASGRDVKTISNQLGHSNAAMTLDKYTGLLPDAQAQAAETIERIMEDAKRAARPAAVVELEGTGTDGR